MARIISFYVLARMRYRISRWIRPERRGRILHFVPGYRGRYVWLPNAALWPVTHQKHEGSDQHAPIDIAR